jgi:hypothetical protein
VRNKESGFLPVLQVMPLSPSFANNDWELTGGGYPYFNQLEWQQYVIYASSTMARLRTPI